MTRPYLLGVDVSYVQRIASGGLIKNATSGATLAELSDFDFVIIKATQGDFVDPQWANSYAMARKFGKKVMAYHFNDNRVGIAKQADLFLATAKNADFLWVDQEGTYAFTDAQTQTFIDRVRAAGRMCGLYHSASGFGGANADGKWVADYRTESLKDADTTVPGWDIWQFSSEGGPAGAGLDLNWLHPNSFLQDHLGLSQQATIDAQAHEIAVLKTELAACNLAHDQDNALLIDASEKLAQATADLEAATIKADGLQAAADADDLDRAAARRLLGL